MTRRFWTVVVAVVATCCVGGDSARAAIVLSGNFYQQDFDALGDGLPAGVTVRTGATADSLGTAVAFDTSTAAWSAPAGSFKNYASSHGLTSSASTSDQAASANRALGIRQTGSFGDPGAAFTFQFANTVGFEDFSLGFDSMILSEQGRTTEWSVQWALGAEPTDFHTLGSFAQDDFGAQPRSFTLASTVNDQPETFWVRVAALSASTGSSSRDSFAIDNVSLSYSGVAEATAVPEPSSMAVLSLATLGGAGVWWRRRRTASASVDLSSGRRGPRRRYLSS